MSSASQFGEERARITTSRIMSCFDEFCLHYMRRKGGERMGYCFFVFVLVTQKSFLRYPHGSDRSRIVILNRNELHAPTMLSCFLRHSFTPG